MIAQRPDVDGAEPERLGGDHRILRSQRRIDRGHQKRFQVIEALDWQPARTRQLCGAMQIGHPNQKERSLTHVLLVPRYERQAASQLWVRDIHDAPQLQVRRTGCGLRRCNQQLERPWLQLFLPIAPDRSVGEQTVYRRFRRALVEPGLGLDCGSTVTPIQALLEAFTQVTPLTRQRMVRV